MATTPDNRPWTPHPIPQWVIKEFIRRQKDIGINYPQSITWGDDGTWQSYKGPVTSWVRLFSNGTGKVNLKNTNPARNGFALQGGYGFDKSYGVPDNKNVLGYDSEGEPHTLNVSDNGNFVSFPNSLYKDERTVQKFLPPPGIVSVESVIQKERIRKVTINWKCYGFAQLEYMTPYFLTPKISAFVEFGWNLFNPASLLDLRFANINQLAELYTTGSVRLYNENIKDSYGLYDVTMGQITGFDFTTQDGITFDCKTEIMSKHGNSSGVQVNGATKVTSKDTETLNVQSTFSTYLEKRLTKLPNCISKNSSGLNFMSPLDENETKALEKKEFKILENFYGGKPEDRFFVGRKNEYGDEDLRKEISSYDWDYAAQESVWVTFGFLVELSNLFFAQTIDINKSDFKLYEIDNKDVIIGAHPNLISCDGNVLLIPNAMSPKFNAGNLYPTVDPNDNDYQKQTGRSKNDAIYLSYFERVLDYKKFETDKREYDRALVKCLKTGFSGTTELSGTGATVLRDDLNRIINRFRHRRNTPKPETSFPRWDMPEPDTGKPIGFWGKIEDLYININVIIQCAKSADTVGTFYNSLLNKISNAAGKFWDLAVIEDDDKLKIIDKKYINYNKSLKIYQFDIGSSNQFIKNINFTAQLSDVAANQVISSASTHEKVNGSPNGTINSNQILPFPYGDRFGSDIPSDDTKNVLIDNNLEVIRQLQNSPQNSTTTNGSYIMSFKSYGPPVPSRADASSPRTTTPLNPNIPAPPSRAAASAPRTTTPLNPNIPAPPSRAAASAPRTTSSNKSSGKESGWNIVNLVLPNESLLLAIINDMDFEKNLNIYGGQQQNFTVEMTLQGISGLRTFQIFSLKNLPSPYSEREIMCQITDITHNLEGGNWTTVIKAGIRSIRGQSITFTTDGINEIPLIK